MWQAFDLEIDGRVQTCYLTAVLEHLNVEQLRSIALVNNVPIHSYMFDQQGGLLYATGKANNKLKAAGETQMHGLSRMLNNDADV